MSEVNQNLAQMKFRNCMCDFRAPTIAIYYTSPRLAIMIRASENQKHEAISLFPITQYEVICSVLEQVRLFKSFDWLFPVSENYWKEIFSFLYCG
jgi:hypothetical protein